MMFFHQTFSGAAGLLLVSSLLSLSTTVHGLPTGSQADSPNQNTARALAEKARMIGNYLNANPDAANAAFDLERRMVVTDADDDEDEDNELEVFTLHRRNTVEEDAAVEAASSTSTSTSTSTAPKTSTSAKAKKHHHCDKVAAKDKAACEAAAKKKHCAKPENKDKAECKAQQPAKAAKREVEDEVEKRAEAGEKDKKGDKKKGDKKKGDKKKGDKKKGDKKKDEPKA